MTSKSLRHLAIRGTAWTILGFGASQVIRFVGNLALTRLLFPEVFGLSALITSFLIGLQMFSDLGVGQSVVQNSRGDEKEFLCTAWTVQIVRGVLLWLFTLVAAAPFAGFYGDPQLQNLLIVAGISALISGFNSITLFTAKRHLLLKELAFLEIGCQLLGLLFTMVWAMLHPSVWAVVAGGVFSTLVKACASHVFFKGVSHRLHIDFSSLKSLMRFGRWIFFSTVLGFFINYGDRLILGKFLTFAELGIFSIATMIAGAVRQVYNKIQDQVLFPVYAKIKNASLPDLRKKVFLIRLFILLVLMPLVALLSIFGQNLIDFFFDPRYRDAGWMVQILSLGLIIPIGSSIGPFYLGFGNSYLFMKLLAIRSFFLLGAMTAGGYFLGLEGFVWGMALSSLFFYPVEVRTIRSYRLWLPFLDFIAIFGTMCIVFASSYLLEVGYFNQLLQSLL